MDITPKTSSLFGPANLSLGAVKISEAPATLFGGGVATESVSLGGVTIKP